MNYVIKVKYEDTLRRLSYPGDRPHALAHAGGRLSFVSLEAKIRDLFKISADSQIRITYMDKDNDVVTMADDQDFEDACVLQRLNPLRLDVTLLEVKKVESPIEQRNQSLLNKDAISCFSQTLKDLPADVVKPVLASVKPLLKEAASSPCQLSELVESIVNTVSSQINSAVRSVDLSSGPVVAEVFAVPSGPKVPTTGTHPVNNSSHRDFVPTAGIHHVNKLPYREAYSGAGFVSSNRDEVNKDDATETEPAYRVFHSGVQCDVCGMCPIVGPRFKSSKQHDYDLCLGCFKELGNASDYTRIDRPLFRPRHLQTTGQMKMRLPSTTHSTHSNFHGGRPFAMRGPYGGRPDIRCHSFQSHNCVAGKLDARFVQDVTIFDGTELPPTTNFTKIWRLRNSGTLPWPVDTKLVHVGGDELGCVSIVPLELPERGLNPGEEVEASVDLVAPEKPGRYVSHWRLASPTGPKFGHRVWVLIQVVKPEEEDSLVKEMGAFKEDTQSSKLTEMVETAVEEAITVAMAETAVEEVITVARGMDLPGALFLSEEYPSSRTTEAVVEPTIEEASAEPAREEVPAEEDMDVGKECALMDQVDVKVIPPIREGLSLLVEPEVVKEDTMSATSSSETSDSYVKEKSPAEEVVPKFVNSELGGFSIVEMPQAVTSPAISSSSVEDKEADAKAPEARIEEGSEVFTENPTVESLCEKLEGMGFNDRKLNLELLQKNDLDVRRTLDDLIAAAEWDPILEELEEMGFYDVEMNRRLMFKNNGSVKRVVKELIQMYKEPVVAAKGKEIA